MTERGPRAGSCREFAKVDGYEPPRVEQVLTPAELDEEIRYAGVDNSVDE